MKILLLTLLVAAASADTNNCPGVYINQTYYDVEIIKEGMNEILSLTFDRNHNTAYYTYEKNDTNVLEYIKLDDKSTGTIDIANPTGLTVDHSRNKSKLYVGTKNGLYQINLNDLEKRPELVHLSATHDITYIFVRRHSVYYVANKTAYEIRPAFDNLVSPVLELGDVALDKFIFDNSFNLHFLSNHKLGKVKRTTKFYYYLSDVVVNDIAENPKYFAYICANDGVYIYQRYADANVYGVDKVSDVKDIKKIAFVSEDEPIYVIDDTLVKLTKNPVPCVSN